jgi:hypothetical protein
MFITHLYRVIDLYDEYRLSLPVSWLVVLTYTLTRSPTRAAKWRQERAALSL